MGFRVEISDEDSEILERLKCNPADVFGQPYGGYLLFLVGGADDEILSWLSSHVEILDSLTGKYVAFAIFAKNFKTKLHVVPNLNRSRRNKHLTEDENQRIKQILLGTSINNSESVDDIIESSLGDGYLQVKEEETDQFVKEMLLKKNRYNPYYEKGRYLRVNGKNYIRHEEIQYWGSVEKLVNNGKRGFVFDEEEINVITYGTDVVARSFGVMHELPCLLVFDATPTQNYKVIPLNQNNLQVLIPILRRSVHSLIDDPNYLFYMDRIRSVTSLQQELSQTQSLIDKVEEEELSWSNERYTNYINQLRSKIFSGLKNGKNSIETVTSVFSNDRAKLIFETNDINKVIEASKNNKDTLFTLSRTIKRMQRYSTHEWPLEEPWLSRYIHIYKNTRTLLSDLPENPVIDTPDQCIEIKEILINKQLEIIEGIINLLPNDSTIEMRLGDKEFRICKRKEELNKRKSEIEKLLEEHVKQLYKQNQPSFIKCFTVECKKEHIISTTKRINGQLVKYMGTWLCPETIIAILKDFGII